MTHVLIRPYKSNLQNIMDTVILLTLILAVNPSAVNFSQSSVAVIVECLVLLPLLLVVASGIYLLFKNHKLAQW